jgi:putative Mg2+ transporter-C (MgtC) family protein
MNPPITTSQITIRLSLAFVAGLIIGYERERHGRAAGFRTTILTCVSAALAMLISEMIYQDTTSNAVSWRPDPARLAAGILTGMGFLGGAGIIRNENVVRGVTTAAVMWFVTILGLAFGSGHLQLGCIGMGIALITLFVLPLIESKIRNDWYATLTIKLRMDSLSEDDLLKMINETGTSAKRSSLDYDLQQQLKTMSWEVKFKKQDYLPLSQKIIHQVIKNPGVLQAKWS